jgi:hypothetical protein
MRVMNKVKVRCSVCGKPFKTPSLKKTVCPACEAEAKRAKHAHVEPNSRAEPVVNVSPSIDVRAALRAAQENQGQFGAYRPPAPVAPVHVEAEHVKAEHVQGDRAAPKAAAPQGATHEERAASRKPRPAGQPRQRVPRPPKEPKPRIQTRPFEPTAEQSEAVRLRYIELAQPEFDGIRHQIATELGIPLKAVKAIIKKTREESLIQSWWDRNGGLPSAEDLERIKELYLPLLPEPEIGVHKTIAAQLRLTNTSVYQAIGQIRAELELPRYLPREGMPVAVEPTTEPAQPGPDGHQLPEPTGPEQQQGDADERHSDYAVGE